MKKLVLLLLFCLTLALAAVYIFIPGKLDIVETASTNCVADAAFRTLSDNSTWSKWWPGTINKAADGTTSYQLQSTAFTVSQKMMNNFELLVHHHADTGTSHMSLLNIPNDSTIIKWQYTVNAGNNPLQRIKLYRESLAVKKDMHAVLVAVQNYLSRFDNVYGFSLHQASTSDTAIISTKAYSATYPSTAFIYGQVDKLKAFCNAGNCNITGIPMLNVTPLDTAGYQVMVALPVENTQPGVSSDIKRQKMIPGQFIITDVTGGPAAIKETHQQLLYYFRDYHRTSMAIPFEYLVTDRMLEPDTSKWVTRIYSPVY